MKLIASLGGALLAAILLSAIVDLFYPTRTLLAIPLLAIFFVIFAVCFGYATVPANLKKKIAAVLVIEGISLIGMAVYFWIQKGFDTEYLFGLTLGAACIIIMILLNNKKNS
ncbi:MAG: hypothetical protein GX409_04625 [candidate division Zixibacteria bacterium]|jgi:peptidoglycan/LPS O-acetylase OafA/YrhL|nr:hypothetical protein [candidate division Zixibacteria bacterium]